MVPPDGVETAAKSPHLCEIFALISANWGSGTGRDDADPSTVESVAGGPIGRIDVFIDDLNADADVLLDLCERARLLIDVLVFAV